MTFRTGKKHKVQESGKSTKNVLRLASRFQRFLNSGVATRKDLKDIDDQLDAALSHQGDKILTLLDQFRDHVPKDKSQEEVDATCTLWAKWLASMDSRRKLGYSGLRSEAIESETHGLLLESAVDAETDLFQMLLGFKTSLSTSLRNISDSNPADLEVLEGAKEIIDAFEKKQKLLAKIASSLKH